MSTSNASTPDSTGSGIELQESGQERHLTVTPSEEKVPSLLTSGIGISLGYIFGRGKRLTPSQRKLAIQYLVSRYGPKCQLCRQEYSDPSKFDIDHINGNRRDHTARNLRLLCHQCNACIGWSQKRAATSSVGVSVSQGCGVGAGVSPLGEDLRAVSRRNESLFRRFYFQQILEVEKEFRTQEKTDLKSTEPTLLLERLQPVVLRAMAREEVGISRASALSYEERLLAWNGPLELKRDEYVGVETPYLGFRDRRCYMMEVEEIEVMFPVEGQLFRRAAKV